MQTERYELTADAGALQAQFLVNEDGLYGMTMLGFFQSPDQGVS